MELLFRVKLCSKELFLLSLTQTVEGLWYEIGLFNRFQLRRGGKSCSQLFWLPALLSLIFFQTFVSQLKMIFEYLCKLFLLFLLNFLMTFITLLSNFFHFYIVRYPGLRPLQSKQIHRFMLQQSILLQW
jgi:hypothetical protein